MENALFLKELLYLCTYKASILFKTKYNDDTLLATLH